MTNTFTDSEGREWNLRFNVGNLRDIRTTLRVDLDGAKAVESFCKLHSDRSKMADVLWIMLAADAAAVNVSDEQFFDSLDGRSLTDAWPALVEAFVTYQPESVQESLRNAIDKQRIALEKTCELICAELRDPAFNAALTKRIEESMKETARKAWASVG